MSWKHDRPAAPMLAAQWLFGNTVLLGAALGSLAILGYSVTRFPNATTAAQIVLYYALPLLAVLLMGWALTRSAGFKANLALVVVSVGISMLAGEFFLASLTRVDPVAEIAESSGTTLDSRTALRVAVDRSDEGELTYPHLSASAARQIRLVVDGERVIPLPGAVPRANTVFCNESGRWETYGSDEHGFRNDIGAWGVGTPEIALLGDSYTQGFCLPGDEGFAATLRKTWPTTLNLGVTAAGPLAELAILREYLVDVEPPIVVWFYYEGNDLPDLTQEIEDPILLRYLEPGFRQRLVARQERISAELRHRLQTLVDGERMGVDRDDPLRRIFAVAEDGSTPLLRLARLQNLLLGAQVPLPAKGSRLGIFPQIMEEALQTVKSWGGELYFVYLPSYPRYRTWVGDIGAERKEVLDVIESLRIKLIDLDATFAELDDPRSAWLHPSAHYTPAAYRLVGETVAARILRDAASSALDSSGGPAGPTAAAPQVAEPEVGGEYFSLRPVTDEALAEFFAKQVDVFGLPIVASEATPDRKVLHAANVMAQYLDNDEDGVPDNQAVVDAMHEHNALLFMFADFDELENSGIFESGALDDYDSQDLEGHETLEGFDAAIEEVHHLIAFAGYAQAFPDAFAPRDSRLAAAMNLARGGHFEEVPDAYPADAWYHYTDRTCDYECMAIEYHYWAITSLLGAQADPERCEEISVEWKPCAPELLETMDPAVFALLTDPQYRIPTVLPDGAYRRWP